MKNHVRVLLCTLPDVFWPETGLERVGMDKMMQPAQVKKAYYKYVQKLHPDKVMPLKDAEKTYIATTVFAAVTEQWDAFKKENNM